jgi:hypothetical protein
MEREDFEEAINQLVAAADLVASAEHGLGVQQLRAFFRLQQSRLHEIRSKHTTDDELFRSTATAALTMAGRKEFPAAAALLEQAQSLLVQ